MIIWFIVILESFFTCFIHNDIYQVPNHHCASLPPFYTLFIIKSMKSQITTVHSFHNHCAIIVYSLSNHWTFICMATALPMFWTGSKMYCLLGILWQSSHFLSISRVSHGPLLRIQHNPSTFIEHPVPPLCTLVKAEWRHKGWHLCVNTKTRICMQSHTKMYWGCQMLPWQCLRKSGGWQ